MSKNQEKIIFETLRKDINYVNIKQCLEILKYLSEINVMQVQSLQSFQVE